MSSVDPVDHREPADDGGRAAERVRVLVADDHPIVRGGLIALLDTLDGVDVVGQVGTGRAAVRAAVEHRPDVVVMDLRMPDLDGVEATRQIRDRAPGVAVLVLTMFDEDVLVEGALAAGARGYLLKGAEGAEIERAIRTVASGDTVLSRSVAERVLTRVGAVPSVRSLGLTPREHEVLDLIARGLGNATIAARLHLSPKTVGNHISAIFTKLGVATRAEAIVRARETGLGRSGPP